MFLLLDGSCSCCASLGLQKTQRDANLGVMGGTTQHGETANIDFLCLDMFLKAPTIPSNWLWSRGRLLFFLGAVSIIVATVLTYISCMDTAYVRENPSPKWPKIRFRKPSISGTWNSWWSRPGNQGSRDPPLSSRLRGVTGGQKRWCFNRGGVPGGFGELGDSFSVTRN